MDPSPLHYHGRRQPRFGKSAKILGHCCAKKHTITQAMRLETHPGWITHPCHTYTRCLTTFHVRWQPRFVELTKILGCCWSTNHTITQAMRLETHPEWITHPCHTYTRCLTTFICNGWAYGSITTSLSCQVAAQICGIDQNPGLLLVHKPYHYTSNEA
jgi:hypothetical protein